jgi:hypothetical protein
MRWENQNVPNSTQKSDIALLTGKIAQLEKRMREIENQLSDLKSYELEASDRKYGIFADFGNDPISAEAPPKKLGRRPRIAPEEMAQRRDYLVEFIEIRWPDLVTGITRRATREKLLATINRACPGAESTDGYIQLTKHIAALQEFLRSGRYKGEPRQIAYALAGLPEMAWRSSFDYCTKNPSSNQIRPEAFLDHIRRHNPNCYRDMLDKGATEENRKLLSRCCAECRRLASNPKWIARVFEDGKPLAVSK